MWRLSYRAAQRRLVCRLEQEQSPVAIEPLQGRHDDPRAGDLGELLHALGRCDGSCTGALLQGPAPGGQRRGSPDLLDREHPLHLCSTLHGPAGTALEPSWLQDHRFSPRAGSGWAADPHGRRPFRPPRVFPPGGCLVNWLAGRGREKKWRASVLLAIGLALALVAGAETLPKSG